MNKTEIKDRLKEVEQAVKDTITNLQSKKEWFEVAIQTIEDLSNHLEANDIFEVFEKDQFKNDILLEFFENELSYVYDISRELRDDIDSYAYELNEVKRDNILEKYGDLESVIEHVSQSQSEYEDITDAIENLNNAIELLKGMY